MRFLFLLLLFCGYIFADTIEYFEDKNSSFTSSSILEQQEFKPYVKHASNFGMSKSTFWIKLEIENQSNKVENKILYFSYPLLDSVTLYRLQAGTLVKENTKGNLIQNEQLFKLEPSLAFEFELATKSVETFYLKVKSDAPMNLDLKLFSQEAFSEYKMIWFASNTFYLGGVLMIILYNFMLYFNVRYRLYIFYVLFHSTFLVLMFTLNGFAGIFLYPHNPQIATVFIPLLIVLTTIWQVIFAYELLELRKYGRTTKKIMQGIVLYGVSIAVLLFFIPYRGSIFLANTVSLAGLSISLFVAIYFWFKRNSIAAKYYTVAWLLLTLGILIEHLKNSGWIPANLFTSYAMQLGILVELIMLSLVLAYRFNQIQAKNIELSSLVITDSLTKIKNRRYFLQRMEELLALLKRKKEFYALAMLDIDHFKKINDTYGHPLGDKVLIEFSKRISSMLREEDLFARIGGEEFILLVRSDTKGIVKLTKRIKDLVESIRIPSEKGEIKFTVSIGITLFEDGYRYADSLLSESDKALYQAKANGRNRIEFYKEQ